MAYLPSIVYPPNKPLNIIITQPTTPVLTSNLFFIDINKKGEVTVSASDISGTGWYGSVFTYKNIEDAVNFKHDSYHIGSSTISDGQYFKNDYLLIAEGTRSLKLLSPADDVMRVEDCFENQDLIEQIAVSDENSHAVICGGRSVEVLKVKNESCIVLNHDYRDYHTETVMSVDINTKEPNVFASASLDRRACIWDDRIANPAALLYVNEFSSLCSIAWHPLDTNLLAVGSAAGAVYLLDKREPKQFVSVANCFNNNCLHRIRFNATGDLAVCGDTNSVVVLDCKEQTLKSIYVSQHHSNVVRGLAWYNDALYTCGFDKKIVKHVL